MQNSAVAQEDLKMVGRRRLLSALTKNKAKTSMGGDDDQQAIVDDDDDDDQQVIVDEDEPETTTVAPTTTTTPATTTTTSTTSTSSTTTSTTSTGEEMCEGHGYGKDECAKVGCCQFAECPAGGGECHSNVGNSACVKRSFASHIEDGSWCKAAPTSTTTSTTTTTSTISKCAVDQRDMFCKNFVLYLQTLPRIDDDKHVAAWAELYFPLPPDVTQQCAQLSSADEREICFAKHFAKANVSGACNESFVRPDCKGFCKEQQTAALVAQNFGDVRAYKCEQIPFNYIPEATTTTTTTTTVAPTTVAPAPPPSPDEGCCNDTLNNQKEMMAMLRALTAGQKALSEKVTGVQTNVTKALDEHIAQVRGDMRAASKAAKYALSVSKDQGNMISKQKREEFRERIASSEDILCPENFQPMNPNVKKPHKKRIFQKQAQLLKQELVVPSSLTYGVAITITIEIEMDLGMDVQFLSCEREVPPLENCMALAELYITTFSQDFDEQVCVNMDKDLSGAGTNRNPGVWYRKIFKGTENQLTYCVQSYLQKTERVNTMPNDIAPKSIKVSAANTQNAFEVTRFLALNSKADPGRRTIANMTSSSASASIVDTYGEYCSRLPAMLKKLHIALVNIKEQLTSEITVENEKIVALKNFQNGTSTGDTTLVIQPKMYAALLSFAVINVKFAILELEGELDLELFSLHLPVTVVVNLKPSIRADPQKTLHVDAALFDGKPTIGAMLSSRPYIRTLSGRLFAKITLFGRSFVSPPVDWTGLKFFINHWCISFGASMDGKCFPDGTCKRRIKK